MNGVGVNVGVGVAVGVGVGVVVRVAVTVGVTVGVAVGQGVTVGLPVGVTVGVPGLTVMDRVLVVVTFRLSMTFRVYVVVTLGHSSLLSEPLTPRPS